MKMKIKKIQNKYTIIQDTREQKPWIFEPDKYLSGSKVLKLSTGDYSIEGLQDVFCIEKKRSTAEISINFFEPRFDAVLDRLSLLKWPFIVCEFTYDEIINFPMNSGIPPKIWPKLKVSANFLLAKITNIQTRYKIPVILAGRNAMKVSRSIMNQVARNEGLI